MMNVKARRAGACTSMSDLFMKKNEIVPGAIVKMPAGYFQIDSGGHFAYVNPAWLRMHKYESADEVLGQHFSLTQTQTDFQEAQEYVDWMLAGNPINSGEFTRKCKDGTVGYHTFSAWPVFEGRKAIGIEGVLIDTTRNKQAEVELRKSEERLKEAQRIGRLGSWEWDIVGNKTTWSDELYRIFVVSPEQFDPDTYGEFLTHIHPEDREKVAEVVQKSLQDRASFNTEYRVIRPDGTVISIHARGEVICDEKGNPISMVGVSHDISELKQAENELVETTHKLRATLNALPDLLFEINRNGCIYDYRAPSRDMLFLSPGEFLGKTVNELFPEEVAAICMDAIGEAAKNGQHFGTVYALEMPGGVRWYELSIAAKDDPKTTDGRLVVLVRDITDRRRAEEALRENEERFRKIFEEGPLGMALVGFDYRLIRVNSMLCRMLGYAEKELLDLTFRDITHPEDIDKDVHLADRLFWQEVPLYKIDKRFITKRKETIWARVTATVICGKDGKPLYGLGMVEDITENKRVEEALRDNKDQLRLITDNLPVLISYVDSTLRYRFNNKTYETIWRKSREDIIGKHIIEVLGEENYKRIDRYIEQALSGNPVSYENKYQTPEGKVQTMLSTLIPHIVEDGSVKGLFCLVEDITERRKSEEELQKAQKLESLGVLAGGIAHDFNNLLGGIFGYIEVAREHVKADPAVSGLLDNALAAYPRAKNLTQQLLTFARGGVPNKQTISLDRLLNQNCSFALSGSNISCELFLGEHLWSVDADEGQLNQVFSNILLNARQAMSAGGRIVVEARNRQVGEGEIPPLTGGRYVEIAFKDHGSGIPEDVLSKIFDPFFTTKNNGLGLGLATSYSIVRNHNGHIAVESDIGAGTVFTIWLPASAKMPLSADEKRIEMIKNGKGRILVMDDEESLRSLLEKMLPKLGYSVTGVSDGEEAVLEYKKALVSEHRFDVVVLDLMVKGGMGGEETIQKLRQIDPGVVGIASSGYSDNPVMADPGRYGFSAIAAKPYRMAELSQILHDTLRVKPV